MSWAIFVDAVNSLITWTVAGIIPVGFVTIIVMVVVTCYALAFASKYFLKFVDYSCQSAMLIANTRAEISKTNRSIKRRKK